MFTHPIVAWIRAQLAALQRITPLSISLATAGSSPHADANQSADASVTSLPQPDR